MGAGTGTVPCASLKATVNGGDVPTYLFSRHPLHKGLMMQSCWVLYTAFPMPDKGTDPHTEDSSLEVTFAQQEEEALAYNTGGAGHIAGVSSRLLSCAGRDLYY